MIFVNFKAYESGTGEAALEMGKIIEEVSEETQIKIIPVCQAVDLREIARLSKLEVWVQAVDAVEFGAHTGSTLAVSCRDAGAKGAFLNHSERKFQNFDDLVKAVEILKGLEMKSLVFASDLDELKRVLVLKPDFVSYEPPELIGSSDKSVASEKLEVISEAVDLSKSESIPLIVGAGIHSKDDIRTSLSLGASGFAIASDIMKAENPRAEMMELVEGYK